MIRLLTLSTALLLTVGVQGSFAQGRGEDKPGKGRDGGAPAQAAPHPGKDPSGKAKGPGKDHPGKGGGPDRRADRDDGPGRDGDRHPGPDRGPRPVVVAGDPHPGKGPKDHPVVVPGGRGDHPRPAPVKFTPYHDYGVIKGCPPGLAKKHNGCLPPGQAKKLRAPYDFRWGDRNDGYVHRYVDGYQYRYDRSGALLGYLPALGGALSPGVLWPAQYRFDPAPRYQVDYYRLTETYDYRYADGAIYSVDPRTSMIQQVVALVTGQSAAVGQRMPAGYDIYNVPYAYRGQYIDTADVAYRYNDGAIYQLDPTTQLIQAVIPLLARAL